MLSLEEPIEVKKEIAAAKEEGEAGDQAQDRYLFHCLLG